MKILKIAALALAVCVALALIVLTVGIDATALGNAALAQLGVEGGMQASLESASFSLRHGLSLRGLEASATTESGSMRGQIEALDMDVAWLPLLRGEVEIRRLALRSPHFEFVIPQEVWNGEAEDAEGEDEVVAGAAPPLRVEAVDLADAVLVVSVEGEPETLLRIEGVDLRLVDVALDPSVVPPLLGATGSGQMTARAAMAGGLSIEEMTATATLANGVAELTELVGRAAGGRFLVPQLRADMAAVPASFSVDLRAEGIDLNLMSGYPDSSALGPASIEASLSGSAEGTLTGEGVVRLSAGGLPPSSSLDALDQLLGTNLAAARYEASELRFAPIPDGLRIEPFELRGEALRIRGRGLLERGQDLDLSLSIALPRGSLGATSYTEVALDAITDTEGWTVFPVQVAGTVFEPSYAVDTNALRGQVEASGRRALENEVRDRIGRVLGGVCCRP